MVPNVPQRTVFPAKAPKSKGLQAELAGRAHFIQDRDSIEKPNYMALIVVFVDVLKVRIQRVVIEIEIGVGVGGALPGIGDGKVISIQDLWLADGGDLSDWGWRASSRTRSCPVRR